MAVFEYHALTSSGRLMKGTLEASSTGQADTLLSEMNLEVQSLSETKPDYSTFKVGRGEFLLFNQQLASLTQAGIPLENGLRELAQDAGSGKMRKVIDGVADDLEKGIGIDEALEKRQRYFPVLYGKIVKAGVESGRLSEMLVCLNRHLEIANQTRRVIFEAICYPMVILALAAVIITLILLLIVPQFKPIFDDFEVELPSVTAQVLQVSDYVPYIWAGFAGFVVVLIIISKMLSLSKNGVLLKESIKFKIPLIGKILHYGLLARLADGVALMIGSGMDTTEALQTSAESIGCEKIKRECQTVVDQVKRGSNLLEAGQPCTTIPKLFLYSMQLGSQRNELRNNLYTLSEMYNRQTRSLQGRLSAFLMPVLLIFVGGVVSTIVVSLFMPIIRFIAILSA